MGKQYIPPQAQSGSPWWFHFSGLPC